MSVAQQLLSDLGKYIGIDELVFDDNGLCTLAFDDEIVVTIVTVEGTISTVCFITEDKDMAHWRKLLEANFAWRETGGATFSLEPGTERVMLSKSWDLSGLSFQQFASDLEIFVNHCETWQTNLTNPSSAKATKTSQAASKPKTKGSDKKGPVVGAARYV